MGFVPETPDRPAGPHVHIVLSALAARDVSAEAQTADVKISDSEGVWRRPRVFSPTDGILNQGLSKGCQGDFEVLEGFPKSQPFVTLQERLL